MIIGVRSRFWYQMQSNPIQSGVNEWMQWGKGRKEEEQRQSAEGGNPPNWMKIRCLPGSLPWLDLLPDPTRWRRLSWSTIRINDLAHSGGTTRRAGRQAGKVAAQRSIGWWCNNELTFLKINNLSRLITGQSIYFKGSHCYYCFLAAAAAIPS